MLTEGEKNNVAYFLKRKIEVKPTLLPPSDLAFARPPPSSEGGLVRLVSHRIVLDWEVTLRGDVHGDAFLLYI